MDKVEVKKAIMKIINSSPGLKRDYNILLKNKGGYMKNIVHEHCNGLDNKYLADTIRYSIANNEEETKTMYKNIINLKVKNNMEKAVGHKISANAFGEIMNEVLDDLVE